MAAQASTPALPDRMPPTGTVVFRVDASVQIGSGHVMRCLALAAALRSMGNDALFVCRAHAGHLAEVIEAHGHRVHLLPLVPATSEAGGLGASWQLDADQTQQAIGGLGARWLVVDHYGIDERWERAVASTGRVLVIDDLADRAHHAHILVDQNIQVRVARYVARVARSTRILVGPRYALLRPEFTLQREAASPRDGRLRHILVTAGGIDQTGLLPKVIQAWADMPRGARPRLDVVVGRSSPNLGTLRRACETHADCALHVQTDRMSSLIDRADLLVTAGGSINWERCCLGVPALLCQTAINQADSLSGLARARTGISLGPSEPIDVGTLRDWLERLSTRPALLRRMGLRSARLVDGHGAHRVSVAMHAWDVHVRPARLEEAEQAWLWRNHESTRNRSTNPAEIPFAQHLAWWRESLKSGDRSLLMAQAGGAAVGVLRLDHAEAAATVSIYLDPRLTGLGIGTAMLQSGHAWVRAHHPSTRRLEAVIRPDNHASTKAFAAAGYRQCEGQWICEIEGLAKPVAALP